MKFKFLKREKCSDCGRSLGFSPRGRPRTTLLCNECGEARAKPADHPSARYSGFSLGSAYTGFSLLEKINFRRGVKQLPPLDEVEEFPADPAHPNGTIMFAGRIGTLVSQERVTKLALMSNPDYLPLFTGLRGAPEGAKIDEVTEFDKADPFKTEFLEDGSGDVAVGVTSSSFSLHHPYGFGYVPPPALPKSPGAAQEARETKSPAIGGKRKIRLEDDATKEGT